MEYISGKSLKEKLDSTLFRVRRFQYFISHTKSLIVKGHLLRDTAGVLSGADIQKSRSSGIVMLAGKYGILDKIWLGIS